MADKFDFLLVNTGHHIDVSSVIVNKTKIDSFKIYYETFSALSKFISDTNTTFIWRTLSPRHFSGHMEWYQGGTCVNETSPGLFPPSELVNGYPVPMINAYAKEVFKNYHILDVESVSRSRGDAHCGSDCTHFIYPGPQHVWNMMLLDIIADELTKEF
jgi:hypothetical protein